ncbi:hypothetical protein [Streptomyces sp. NPDC088254]|uniref:hypothetical protein n=1 Tax=Streptomyces sp. NPDC088254 TaxID=3365847 RepID=UPI00382748CC
MPNGVTSSARPSDSCSSAALVGPSRLAVAAHRDDERPLVLAYLAAAAEVAEVSEVAVGSS